MKYKIGDKIKIKEDFIADNPKIISDVNKLLNRVMTVKEVYDYYCFVEENEWSWGNDWLEEIIEKEDPILSRFELLDL